MYWKYLVHMFWRIPNLKYMISRICLFLFIGNWFSYRWEQFYRRNRACSKDDSSCSEDKWTYIQEEYCVHGYSSPVWQWQGMCRSSIVLLCGNSILFKMVELGIKANNEEQNHMWNKCGMPLVTWNLKVTEINNNFLIVQLFFFTL